MRPRHAVLLTPSKSSRPSKLLSRQHIIRVSSLDATLMSSLVNVAIKGLKVGLSLLDATLTKNMGVGALPSRSGTHPSAPATVIRALSFHALTHCPFCNSSLFTHMHVMGGGTPLTTPAARSFTTVNSRCSYDFPPVTSHQSRVPIPLSPTPQTAVPSSVYILPVLSCPFCFRRIAHSSRLGGRHE
jgi:hypothetical protein